MNFDRSCASEKSLVRWFCAFLSSLLSFERSCASEVLYDAFVSRCMMVVGSVLGHQNLSWAKILQDEAPMCRSPVPRTFLGTCRGPLDRAARELDEPESWSWTFVETRPQSPCLDSCSKIHLDDASSGCLRPCLAEAIVGGLSQE